MQINIHCEVYRLVGQGWIPDSGWESRHEASVRALDLANQGETAMIVAGQDAVVAEPVLTGVFWQPIDDWLDHVRESDWDIVLCSCPTCGGSGEMQVPPIVAGDVFEIEYPATLVHLDYDQLLTLRRLIARGMFLCAQCQVGFSYSDYLRERRRKLKAIQKLFPL